MCFEEIRAFGVQGSDKKALLQLGDLWFSCFHHLLVGQRGLVELAGAFPPFLLAEFDLFLRAVLEAKLNQELGIRERNLLSL